MVRWIGPGNLREYLRLAENLPASVRLTLQLR